MPDWLQEGDGQQDGGSAAPDGAAPRMDEMENGGDVPNESEGSLVLPRGDSAQPVPVEGETPVGNGSTEGS